MLGSFVGEVMHLLKQGILWILKGYRYWISPQLGQRCRFYPSCSHYAMDALMACNLQKGLWLIFKRVIRCHPFSPGGYDPVKMLNLKNDNTKPLPKL